MYLRYSLLVHISVLFSFLVVISATTQPVDLLPGIEYIGFGWDVITGRSMAQQVVNLTYTQQKQFTNPYNSSAEYLYPDQVTAISSPDIQSTSTSNVFYSSSDYATSSSVGIDFGVGLNWVNMLSASVGVKQTSSYLQQRSQFSSATESTMIATIYQASLPEPEQLSLSPEFLAAISALPAEYDEVSYAQFISYWGTHFLASSYFGGMGTMSVAVNTESAQTFSSDEISQQAQVQFDFFKTGEQTSQASAWFLGSGSSSSSITTTLVGGDPSIPSSLTNWNKWIESFYNFPVPIFNNQFPINVVPLYSMIANSTIQNNMIQAVEYYLASNPYPANPACMEKTYCAGQCYPFGDVCCGATTRGCSSGDYPGCCETILGQEESLAISLSAGQTQFIYPSECISASQYPSINFNYSLFSTHDDTYSIDFGVVLCGQYCCEFSSSYQHDTAKYSGDYTVANVVNFQSGYSSYFYQFDVHCQNMVEDCSIYLDYLYVFAN